MPATASSDLPPQSHLRAPSPGSAGGLEVERLDVIVEPQLFFIVQLAPDDDPYGMTLQRTRGRSFPSARAVPRGALASARIRTGRCGRRVAIDPGER
jgi:hypothetical protein